MLKGSCVALVTPMQEDGAIDWQALSRLVHWHMEQGTDALVIAGTTGESATLNVAEHCALIEAVVKLVDQRIPVIAGTGANATDEAITLTRAAHQVGADACLLVTPYYNKPTQEGLYQHYKAVAEAVAVPQILYNVPTRTACDMTTATVLRLAEIDNIIGVKEATGNIARAKSILQHGPQDFAVYSGDDPTAVDLMLAGGHGTISVTANIVPARLSALAKVALSGDQEQAQAMQNALMPLHQALFLESNPIPVKWALHQLGYIQPYLRLPMTPLSDRFQLQVKQVLISMGLINIDATKN